MSLKIYKDYVKLLYSLWHYYRFDEYFKNTSEPGKKSNILRTMYVHNIIEQRHRVIKIVYYLWTGLFMK